MLVLVLDEIVRDEFVDRGEIARADPLEELTCQGLALVDQQLPALHAVIAQAISTLAEKDREHLLTSLTTIRTRVSQIASQPLPPAKARRRRRSSNAGRSAR